VNVAVEVAVAFVTVPVVISASEATMAGVRPRGCMG
jgi:hypothetical protein